MSLKQLHFTKQIETKIVIVFMFKTMLIFLIGVCVCPNLYSQNQALIDSLSEVVQSNVPNNNKVDAYIKIAAEYSDSDSINTSKYANMAIRLAAQTGYQEGKINALFEIGQVTTGFGHYTEAARLYKQVIKSAERVNYQQGKSKGLRGLGVIHLYLGDYEEALDYHLRSLEITEKLSDKKGVANNYSNIGVIYHYQGNYEKALDSYFKSLSIEQELRNKKGIGKVYNNIAMIFYNQGNYPKALEHHLKSLKIKKELGDKKNIALSYNNLGVIYEDQGNYPKALSYHFKSLKIREELGDKQGITSSYGNLGDIYQHQGNYEKALDYYFKSLKIRKELGDKYGIATNYNDIGKTYKNKGNYDKALDYSDKSLEIYNKIGAKAEMTRPMILIGEIFYEQQHWTRSRKYLRQGLQLAKEKGVAENIRDASRALALVEKKLGNYKSAYESQVLFKRMADSLKNEELAREITRLEDEYEFQQEKDSIQFINKSEYIILKKDIEKRKIVQRATYIGLGLTVILLLILFLFLRSKMYSNKLLAEKSEELEQANHEVIQQADKIVELNRALEQSLDETIRDLLFKNKKLSEYAFYNSHETRAPISRLLGIINIIDTIETESERTILLQSIKQSCLELDAVIKKMNHILDETGFFE